MIYPDVFFHFPSPQKWKSAFRRMFIESLHVLPDNAKILFRPWVQSFSYTKDDANKRGRKRISLDSALMHWQIDFLNEQGCPYLLYDSTAEYSGLG